MAGYESELTVFLKSLQRAQPAIAARQREGRALWWDRFPDADTLRRWRESRVPQDAYVYYAPAAVKSAADS